MKRKPWIVVLWIVCVLAFSACEKEGKSDEKSKDGLMDVWRVTKKTKYEYTTTTENVSVVQIEYDRYGNWTLTERYDDGKRASKIVKSYEYDDKGRLLRDQQQQYIDVDTEDERTVTFADREYSYDDATGLRTGTIDYPTYDASYTDVEKRQYEYVYYDGGMKAENYTWYKPESDKYEELAEKGLSRELSWEFEYCVDERRKSTYYFPENGNRRLNIELKYNERGNVVRDFMQDGAQTYDTEYVYDDDGVFLGVIENGTKSFEGGPLGEFTPTDKEYDREGRLLQDYEYTSGGKQPFRATEYRYDDDGNLVETVTYQYNRKTGEKGNLYERTVYEYDENGNLTVETRYNSNGKVTYKLEQEWKKFRCRLEAFPKDEWDSFWFENVRLGEVR